MSGFHERKAARKQFYEAHVKGWKLRDCGACDGTGFYDNNGSPYCGACAGTGKERYKPDCEHRHLSKTINGYKCDTCDHVAEVLLSHEEYSLLIASDDVVETLKREAQGHAMEAETQKSTLLEIYQALGIKKGDWNGAAPVLAFVKELQDFIDCTERGFEP